MKTPLKACGTAIAVVALGLALAGCGSDSKTEATSSSSSSASSSSKTSESKPSKTEEPAGAKKTIADYVKDAGLTETPVKRGDPGSPTIDLPFPAGWEDAGANTPEWAYGAIVNTDPAFASSPPTIIAIVSKLTGPVEPAKIFEFAPGELNNLPGFQGPEEAEKSALSGFDAVQMGGSYVKDGVSRMIAQKTVVIPAKDGDGVYVLQLNADGTEDQMNPLMEATTEIDKNTTITP